jgi:decaprenylphospho-beta-D-erythro-pentofuranosid-2-ulose 2-reductase
VSGPATRARSEAPDAQGSAPRPGRVAGRRVVLVGGSSEIGLAIVAELQRHAPREVALVGREGASLDAAAAKLRAAGCASVTTVEVDALDTDRHGQALDRALAALGGADIVIVAVGVLGEPAGGADGGTGVSDDADAAVEVLRVNTVGAGSLLLRAAERLRAQGGGVLVALSSVAAERPRPANYVYGASKAGLDALARGLGDALYDEGVQVLVVRPGFVRTRMTRGLPAAPLAVEPDAVARATVAGLRSGAQVVWVPAVLRWLMLVIRLLPRQLFRRIRQ